MALNIPGATARWERLRHAQSNAGPGGHGDPLLLSQPGLDVLDQVAESLDLVGLVVHVD